jgi:hypothetical protein
MGAPEAAGSGSPVCRCVGWVPAGLASAIGLPSRGAAAPAQAAGFAPVFPAEAPGQNLRLDTEALHP